MRRIYEESLLLWNLVMQPDGNVLLRSSVLKNTLSLALVQAV